MDTVKTGAPPVGPVGRYQIRGRRGEGGMGVVYRAFDPELQREVALKRLRPDRFSGPNARQRLMREARAASRLSHPNIVPIFDVFEHDGALWIVMEFVQGQDLRDLLKVHGALSTDDVLRYSSDLAAALAAAHSKRVLHRDVNPRNVLIARNRCALLTDFGLACLYVPPEEQSRVSTVSEGGARDRRAVGTPGYISPEQILGRGADPRSDLFALGLVMYEMCTGRPAFTMSSEGNVTDAILHRQPPPIQDLNGAIPGELERIVRKAILKRPDERYQEANDMLADLRHLRRSIESGEETVEYDVVAKSRRAAARRRSRIAAAIGASLIITAAVAAWQLVPGPEDDPVPPAIPRQLTAAPGWEVDPVLSPDGELVAFASNQSGNEDLWIVDAAGGRPLQLTDDAAVDARPAWFPDGRSIAFISNRGEQWDIWRIPRLGGSPMLLIPDGVDPAVSPDGRSIAFARATGGGPFRIHVASIDDPSHARALTDDEGGLWDHREPAWSPDGGTICYQDWLSLWLVPAAGGPARRLTHGETSDSSPAWSADGRHVYFSSLRGSTRALWRIRPPDGPPARLTLGTGPEFQPHVSSDGRRLAYSTLQEDWDIVLFERDTGARTRFGGVRLESDPALSAGADRLLYVSDREGSYDLWQQDLSEGRPQGEPRKLADLPGGLSRPEYSPDGRWISFGRNIEGERDIWIMPAGGGPAMRVTADPAPDIHPSWSPDGTALVFASERDGGSHLWVTAVLDGKPSGAPRQITAGPCRDWFPSWSPDGASIAFVRVCEMASDVWVVAADGAGEARRVTEAETVHHARWDPASGDLIVRAGWDGVRSEIRQVDPTTGRTTPFDPPFDCGEATAFGTLTVSSDGRFLSTMVQEARGDLWVLEAGSGRY